MLLWQTNALHQLNELHLIQSSLLPGERFAFVLPPDSEDLGVWTSLLDTIAEAGGFDDNGMIASLTHPPCQARFEVRIVGVPVWFEVVLPELVPTSNTLAAISISVRGEHLSRDDHIHWQSEVRARMNEVMRDDACAFPVYEVLTLLIAALHQSQESESSDRACDHDSSNTASSPSVSPPELPYHALLTSHHLISPTKRRSLQQWSSQLSISGFAKVGYPGVIYVEGPQEAVETFARNVKGMQWLALRVRFVEPIPESQSVSVSRSDGTVARNHWSGVSVPGDQPTWVELTKIGEVLEHMRSRGREALVTNLGIGVPSKETKG